MASHTRITIAPRTRKWRPRGVTLTEALVSTVLIAAMLGGAFRGLVMGRALATRAARAMTADAMAVDVLEGFLARPFAAVTPVTVTGAWGAVCKAEVQQVASAYGNAKLVVLDLEWRQGLYTRRRQYCTVKSAECDQFLPTNLYIIQ
ncbi:hypothetical protein GX586_04145 [bacterium]|nr:hypothetical protein [bacterium]